MNEFNAMLSFGNTILYDQIAFCINRSALDIRAGFLHATNSVRMGSLNLDIAEIFKPLIVDRVVLSLINTGAVRLEHFRSEDNGAVYLNTNGRRIFLRVFYAKLNESLKIGEKNFTYYALIEEEVRKPVRSFRTVTTQTPHFNE